MLAERAPQKEPMTDPGSGTASNAERAAARVGLKVANRYQLEALLGLGATGAVYRAGHPGGHSIAVKILDPDLMASDAATRFVRESELMLSIHHPNVVQTLAAGRDDALGLLYLAMPLLRGEDLDAVLQRLGPLDPTTSVRIALQAARGIAAAHRLGIVHRDIKPGNLFIDTQPDGKITVRVCDFGIAKSAVGGTDVSLTRTGSQLGTPDYISPEQLKDSKSADHRADVWGLGATLYEMLSGRPPFAHHERVFDVIAAILTEEIAWLQDRAPWIDADLARVVHSMLRRSPGERIPTMDRLIDELLPFSGGDGALTSTHLVRVSPILAKIPKPRGEPPPPQIRRVAKPTPPESGSAVVHPPAARPAEAVKESIVSTSNTKTARKKQTPSRRSATPRSGRAGCLFFLLLLLVVVAASVFFWPELELPQKFLELFVRHHTSSGDIG